jgi:hypothetical protein
MTFIAKPRASASKEQRESSIQPATSSSLTSGGDPVSCCRNVKKRRRVRLTRTMKNGIKAGWAIQMPPVIGNAGRAKREKKRQQERGSSWRDAAVVGADAIDAADERAEVVASDADAYAASVVAAAAAYAADQGKDTVKGGFKVVWSCPPIIPAGANRLPVERRPAWPPPYHRVSCGWPWLRNLFLCLRRVLLGRFVEAALAVEAAAVVAVAAAVAVGGEGREGRGW